MDCRAFQDLYEAFKYYNDNLDENYGNTVVDLPPQDPEFPVTIIHEVRNVAKANYNSCRERVASVGYRVDIYAKNKGELKRNIIAGELAEQFDKFFTLLGLTRTGFNTSASPDEGSAYVIMLTFTGDFDEYRRRFI